MSITDLIVDLSHRGVRLWLDGDQVRFKAPQGTLTSELKDQLVQHKSRPGGVPPPGAVVSRIINAAADQSCPARRRSASFLFTRTTLVHGPVGAGERRL